MAIDDIKKHIQDKAQEEIAKIDAAASKDAQALELDWKDRIGAERERLIAEINQNADSKLAQAKFKIREKINAEKLKTKQAQLDEVYERALETISKLPEADYTAMLEKLLAPLKDLEGTLHTSAKRAAELNKAAKSVGCKAKISDEDLGIAGGFVFEGEKVDLDSTFETLMNKVREESIIEVHKQLFNI
ncbi:MAG: hypothetical protein ABIG32_00665 [Candidatus Uhrbacteria bacterium]|nr:hypothetical protein [Patescibacteria group bacterium]MBU1907202.1 hypothetical protein [Patescibacteria group bacterium]